MNVSYLGPAQRSIDRARRMLFHPFRMETWLAVGFAAFLSEWLSGGFGSGGSGNFGGRHRFGGVDARDGGESLRMVIDKVRDIVQNPFWMGMILWIVAAAVALIILFQWLGSRGKFVLLDATVRERATIGDSWRRLGHLGDSLFLFRVLFGALMLVVVGGVGFLTVGAGLRELFLGREDPLGILVPMVGGLLLLSGIGFVFAFVFWLLDYFVVPVMYRHGIGVGPAWGRFLPLFGSHLLSFLAFGVLVVLCRVLEFAMIMVAGLVTCCVGFVLFAIPYVGQVVLLPFYVYFRGLGPDFLAQFGPEFDVYATAPAAADAPLAPPPAPMGPTA